ncbi:MAG: hypothetical protein D6E12_12785 [Desulfovibrio sp.]|nr:MAG: hypothetical protein D6E12_12785 [Desulfovibrio sp.]
MKEHDAVALFRGKGKLNCTQAILKAFQEESGVSDAVIKAAKSLGGGKAPEGSCGAFHAARILLGEQAVTPVAEAFEAEAGSTRCRRIRAMKKFTCRDCVALSAKVLEQHLDAVAKASDSQAA